VDFLHWLTHFLGADDAEGHWYNFWSGFGADLGQVALFGAVIGIYRKHNCHVHRCWRIGKQPVIGTSWMVCHHHHPEGRPTAEDVANAHAKFRVAEREALDLATRVAERNQSGTDRSSGNPP
jgi:hypothetical protein